ncbi:MAG: hypothetical protein HY234_10380 [Acidobacteria bacterium]|nr:hypothetical protein [Acidobacteriota bacterium]
MKRFLALGVAVSLFLLAAPPAQSQSNQLLQGTQLRLVLLNGLTTSVAREGDPFVATIAEPVYIGGQLVLPAGARVNGEISQIIHAKRFGLLRGQAAMYLKFKSIEIDRREIPAPMSIISIHETSVNGRARKDVRTEEGVIVEARRDVKGALATVALGGGGGSVIGTVFSHAMRGLAIGLIGGSTYVMVKKGKEVELPAQTGILVRLDTTITLPVGAVNGSPYTGGQP